MKWRIVEERNTYTMFGTYTWFLPECRPSWWPFWRRATQGYWRRPVQFTSLLHAQQWIQDQQPLIVRRELVVHPI